MSRHGLDPISVQCPCCGARLTIDAELGRVLSHEPPPPSRAGAPDLGRASELLEQQAARREAIFRRSSEDEKVKSSLLERKFAEGLRTTKDKPVERPTRDIDLD